MTNQLTNRNHATTAASESPGRVDWFGITSVDTDKLFALESTRKALNQVKRIEDAANRKCRRGEGQTAKNPPRMRG